MPPRIDHQFIGYEIAQPISTPIRVTNQRAAWLRSRFGWNDAKRTKAIQPKSPTSNAVHDSVSPFIAVQRPGPNESPCIGAIAKYWNTIPSCVRTNVVADEFGA